MFQINYFLIFLCLQLHLGIIKCFITKKNILENISWECANNSSCTKMLSLNFLEHIQKSKILNFGIFTIESVPEFRSLQSINPFFDKSLNIPLENFILKIQRFAQDKNYLEISLLKNLINQNNNNESGRKLHKGKKNLQILIPLYLAANTFGWTLAASKGVAVIIFKAFMVSKLALLLAGLLFLKMLLNSSSENNNLNEYEPNNWDYGYHTHTFSSGPEIYSHGLYPMQYNDNNEISSSALEGYARAESKPNRRVFLPILTQHSVLNKPKI